MLELHDKYLLQQRFVSKAMEVRFKAKTGRDYCCDLNEALKMDIKISVIDQTIATEVQSQRIFENIFE